MSKFIIYLFQNREVVVKILNGEASLVGVENKFEQQAILDTFRDETSIEGPYWG